MKFSKIRMLMILFSVVLLSSCIQKSFIFTGESNNWRVQYEIKDNTCEESRGYFKYIGNSSIPDRVEYTIDNLEGSVTLDENGVYIFPNGCSNASEVSEIEAIIEWDEKSETIPLSLK